MSNSVPWNLIPLGVGALTLKDRTEDAGSSERGRMGDPLGFKALPFLD